MDTYWIPGVNRNGRWAFAEFTEVYKIESDFAAKVEAEFHAMIDKVRATQPTPNIAEPLPPGLLRTIVKIGTFGGQVKYGPRKPCSSMLRSSRIRMSRHDRTYCL